MDAKKMKVIKNISVGSAFVAVISLIVAIVLFKASGMWMSNANEANVAMSNVALWVWRIAVTTFMVSVSGILSSSFSK